MQLRFAIFDRICIYLSSYVCKSIVSVLNEDVTDNSIAVILFSSFVSFLQVFFNVYLFNYLSGETVWLYLVPEADILDG